jgi:hypothetical protein
MAVEAGPSRYSEVTGVLTAVAVLCESTPGSARADQARMGHYGADKDLAGVASLKKKKKRKKKKLQCKLCLPKLQGIH